MDFVKYRVKVMENFKDGNILGGKFLKANDIVVVTETEFAQITNSGGILEILESMIPNPKKELPEVKEARLAQLAAEVEAEIAKENEVAQAEEQIVRAETPKPEKKKPGRKPGKKVS